MNNSLLPRRLFTIFIVFLAIYFLSISFSETNYPFSRLGMFAGASRKACSKTIYQKGRFFPTKDEQALLEIQKIVSFDKHRETNLCADLKENYGFLPSKFEIVRRCLHISEEGKVVTEDSTILECPNEN